MRWPGKGGKGTNLSKSSKSDLELDVRCACPGLNAPNSLAEIFWRASDACRSLTRSPSVSVFFGPPACVRGVCVWALPPCPAMGMPQPQPQVRQGLCAPSCARRGRAERRIDFESESDGGRLSDIGTGGSLFVSQRVQPRGAILPKCLRFLLLTLKSPLLPSFIPIQHGECRRTSHASCTDGIIYQKWRWLY